MGEQQSTEGVPTDRREKVAWYLFDFANTSFTVLIVTALFPLYFRTLVGDPLLGDTLWGYAGSITMLIIALTSPVLGAMADYTGGFSSGMIYQHFLALTCGCGHSSYSL
ncbi:MAG: hypothetical protein ACXAAR_10350 [Candidatus Thorarchaeota archaeon]